VKFDVQRTWYGVIIFYNTTADNAGIYEGKQAPAVIKASNVMFAVD
jgi:molybdopterin-binding protein